MSSRFFRKFFLTTSILIIFSLSIIMVIVSFFVNNYLINERHQTLYDNCHSVAVVSANGEFPSVNSDLYDVMHALANSNGNTIIAVDMNGSVIACGCDDWFMSNRCVHSQMNVSAEIMEIALSSKYDEIGDFGGRFQEQYITSGIPIEKKDGAIYGAVFASSPLNSVKSFFSELLKMFLISAAIPLIILFIVEYIISYKFTKPLRLMSQAAKRMANGDFSMRVPVNSKDETGQLAESFNEMTEALVRTESTRRSFIANVSHELRTPMTSIGGFIDGIIDGTIDREQEDKYLRIVSNEVKRLSRLVQSMLNLAKLEAGEQQIKAVPFDLSKTIIEIVFSKESSIEEKNLKIIGLDDLGEVNIVADYDLIYQVMYNLIDNAVKFNCQNGFIEFDLKDENETVTFKIRNGGSTIAPQDLPFIFERFYKGDKSRAYVKDSTGLGLYIVKTIVNLHGGTITADSIPDKYTEFTMTIPQVCNPKPKIR